MVSTVFAYRSGDCQCDEDESVRRRELIRYARQLAAHAARRDPLRLCTIDDVRERLERSGHRSDALGRAASSVFRTTGWEPTRLRVRSRRPEAHRREVVVWRHYGKRGVPLFAENRLKYNFVVDDASTVGTIYQWMVALESTEGALSQGGGGAYVSKEVTP